LSGFLGTVERKHLERGVTFTFSGALAGARQCIPIEISGFAVGLVFGVLARQEGLSVAESVLMSALVFSGAAQFVVLGLWGAASLPVANIALTTLVVGLRHLLMGAALSPFFSRLPRFKAYGSVFFMADENWALAMSEFSKGKRDAAFLLGGGLAMFISWTTSTLIGRTIGGVLQDPSRWGLDFAFTAVFLALLVGMWEGRSGLLPWAVAALVAVTTHHWLPGQWYILLGGLTGSLAGAVRRAA
jgi:4-azaleucine resistance transporter AzlC